MIKQSGDNKEDFSEPDLYAAADLGSNSFHMIIARYSEGGFRVIERVRDVVRLADGLDEMNFLTPETRQRAHAVLLQFRLHLGKVPPANTRIVGTSALRSLNAEEGFIASANDILGLPVDIISGQEEARLINLGVAGNEKNLGVSRLIIDIGGGSTEIIVGKDVTVLAAESIPIGCVAFSSRFFPGGKITPRSFKNALKAADSELQPVRDRLSNVPWFDVIGASGTIKAVRKIISAQEWGSKEITMRALDKVIAATMDAGDIEGLNMLKGLARDRVPVFPGGLAILKSIMQGFGLKSMRVSKAAMREGILFDLLRKKN